MVRKGYRSSPVEYEAFKRNPQWSKNNNKDTNKSNKSKRYSKDKLE